MCIAARTMVRKESKRFFFEKKNQKTFACCGLGRVRCQTTGAEGF
jgi:hypothetical protein